MSASARGLLKKIEALPPERTAKAEDFIDFIARRNQDRLLVRSAAKASLPAFEAIRNNPEDDVYDEL